MTIEAKPVVNLSRNATPMVKAREILTDPSASAWLRDALASALDRDLVDAANDAEVLAEVLAGLAGRALRMP